MGEPSYALVAYLSGPLSEFIRRLRTRLNPDFADWHPHVTILPPRPLRGDPQQAIDLLRDTCAKLEPFVVTVDAVDSFLPRNSVVFLALSRGSPQLVTLHRSLNCEGLAQVEQFEYVPHLTIAQQLDEAGTLAAIRESRAAWNGFRGERSFRVESLRLVRQTPENQWIDLATLPLGTALERV